MKNINDFYCGNMFNAYNFFGAHIHKENNTWGILFKVYAPNAKKVEVISDFNNWDGNKSTMIQLYETGIFTYFSTDAKVGMFYKYRIFDIYGNVTEKIDPYGFAMELRPKCASIITDLNKYKFCDDEWISNRNKNFDKPLNIYEVHLGSWKHKNVDLQLDITEKWFNYKEIAPQLINYVKENNYTHIEILPLCEHPCDNSWGYQVTGFFSPTARYGNPDDLMEFIDLCHRENIGVIMDFVIAHFALDDYGLCKFDGDALYEYPHPDISYTEWGSYNFNYYRGEVRSFLQSCANFWIEVYHIDGIRMDAVGNVIYWKGDEDRGINEGAIEYIKNMNQNLNLLHPDVMLIAEDSSSYPDVTKSVEDGGLGFDYKWNMGWMNDTLLFFSNPPWKRNETYHKITFSMMYFYNENYLLPLSHDEVVHEKKTILDKMWGDYEEKFAQAKVLYAYMFTHPGKKLNFMGNEIGHFREWDENKEVDWILLDYPKHHSLKKFINFLNKLYITSPSLYEKEYSRESFHWLEADDTERCVYIYERKSSCENFIIFINASNNYYSNYTVNIDNYVDLEEVLNTDWIEFGGNSKPSNNDISISKDIFNNICESEKYIAEVDNDNNIKTYKVCLNLQPYSCRIFKYLL